MNTYIPAAFRRHSRRILFTALVSAAAFQAQAGPGLPFLFSPPEISTSDQTIDTRLWRYVPGAPRGAYEPAKGTTAQSSVPQREVERWVGPRGTVPAFRNDG
jgi:hypothetical protein